jgi:hypothetical protein
MGPLVHAASMQEQVVAVAAVVQAKALHLHWV